MFLSKTIEQETEQQHVENRAPWLLSTDNQVCYSDDEQQSKGVARLGQSGFVLLNNVLTGKFIFDILLSFRWSHL